MKAFGLAHVAPDELPRAFVEIRPFLGHCRFRDCRHASEPGCAVREAVDGGHIAAHRLALLHTLVAASTAVRAPGAKAPSTRA
jgi:ribosome biogenesis GTPase